MTAATTCTNVPSIYRHQSSYHKSFDNILGQMGQRRMGEGEKKRNEVEGEGGEK
jgi:hypothetical protein